MLTPPPSPSLEPARPGFRLTASDRPGVAQPVPERDIPPQPWGRVLVLALLLFVLLTAAWEAYWRTWSGAPGYRNSPGEWALQRRRVDTPGGATATVLTGSSRVLFDIQLAVWQRSTGVRPIQLAMEGTTPLPVLEGLAKDPAFHGRLLVGVAPDIFFTGFANRGSVFEYARKEGPSRRIGNWLSMHFIEPYFAFDDPDFALAAVLLRQPWPLRDGAHASTRVRKLAVQTADRNSHMWWRVERDPGYQALARSIWAERFGGPPRGLDTVAKRQKAYDTQIERAVKAVAMLRSHGVTLVFVRMPSAGEYYAYEQKYFPRADTWDKLIARTGAPGLHFEDHAQMQGYELPEWSHMSASEAQRFTAVFAPLAEQAFASAASAKPQAGPASAHAN
jgi:hypothetical protein